MCFLKELTALFKKNLELIKNCKIAGYKDNTKGSVAFLYTNNEQSEKKTTKTISFIIASKRIKYLGIHLTKKVEDWYIENHKILLKELKKKQINVH